MNLVLLVLLFSIAACTSTLDHENLGSTAVHFDVTSKDGPSEKQFRDLPDWLCNLNIQTVVDRVWLNRESDSYSSMEFSNSEIGQKFSILFYFDDESGMITPLIMHSEDDSAEPLGMMFDVGESMIAIVAIVGTDMKIAVEPLAKFDFKNFADGEEREFEIDFSLVKVGFKPDRVTFFGVSVDARFESLSLSDSCL